MKKPFPIKEESEQSGALDTQTQEVSGTTIEAIISEATIAFHYDKRGTVREFLATPSGLWQEMQPGGLINGDLAHGYYPRPAMDVLEGRVDIKKDADIDKYATLISESMIADYPLWVAPAQVPLEITVPRGRRTFKAWMTARGYEWTVHRETLEVHLVTRGGKTVRVPEDWMSAFNELSSQAQTVWGPAISYVSLPVNQLRWAEAIMVRERGARLRMCRAGHPFVWIGRATKQWCSWHERERDVLESRYSRESSATEKKLLLAKLRRFGLRGSH